jgi:hypothetical protein
VEQTKGELQVFVGLLIWGGFMVGWKSGVAALETMLQMVRELVGEQVVVFGLYAFHLACVILSC